MLQSMGLQRVGYDLVTEQQQHGLAPNELLEWMSEWVNEWISIENRDNFYVLFSLAAHSIVLRIWASLVTQRAKNACSVGDPGLIPGWRRSPGEGNGNPLQYSCLENSTDGKAWQATVNGLARSWTRLSNTFTQGHIQLNINLHICGIQSELWEGKCCPWREKHHKKSIGQVTRRFGLLAGSYHQLALWPLATH